MSMLLARALFALLSVILLGGVVLFAVLVGVAAGIGAAELGLSATQTECGEA